jgi:hypothetical protein
MPFDVFPDHGGLLPFSLDEANVRMCWLTQGRPDSWPIVIMWQRGPDGFQVFNVTLVEFLTRILIRDITLECWPEPVFMDKVAFVPSDS